VYSPCPACGQFLVALPASRRIGVAAKNNRYVPANALEQTGKFYHLTGFDCRAVKIEMNDGGGFPPVSCVHRPG